MQYTTLKYEIEQHILTLTLNRPEVLNAFSVTMAEELVQAFNAASADDEVRAIVVTGSGRAFCAGMDLQPGGNVFGLDESQRPDLDGAAVVRDTGGVVTLAMYDCTKPIIGAINGVAVGIGATMTLAMDVRLASEKARFGFVFAKLGVVNEACSSWFLPKIVGMSQALDWLYSGEIFDAAEALRGGLVRAVYAVDELLPEAYKLAHKYVDSTSAVSIALIRQTLYRESAQPHPMAAHRQESLNMFYTSMGDGKEGVNAFLEKRPPQLSKQVSVDMPPTYPWWQEPKL
jgi:enoyl-CoA hydratase/carnithine racemase